MPRRPKSNSKKSKRPRPLKRSDASIQKWNAPSDIPLDEVDEFHASRDRILLEGDDINDLEEDDEVFTLKGLDQDESESEAEDEQGGTYQDDAEEVKALSSKKVKNRKNRKTREPPESEESEEGEESWGRKTSAYYSSNAAQIESDDEEALELEENEALRLQAKSRDGMGDNDFGLNDPREENGMETDDLNFTEPTPVILPPLPHDKKSILRHLEKNNPEALALAGDWDDAAHNLLSTRAKLEKLQSETPDSLSLGMIHLYHQTLLTYTSTLAFYLHLRAHEKYAQRPESLRTHPIMARLLTLKQGLATLEDLDFTPSDLYDELDADEEEEDVDVHPYDLQPGEKLMRLDYGGLEPLELSELLKDAFSPQEESVDSHQVNRLPKPPKKKRKISKESPKPALPVFDLVEPEFISTKASSNQLAKDMTLDAFGEALSLQHADAADKSARRKSLRFHTAKIESASVRRQGARQALGGDDDIPYRERLKEKEARLLKETRAHIKNQGGDDLDADEPETRPHNQTKGGDSESDADLDGYYNLVKRTSKLNKEKKKAKYEAEKAALRPSLGDEESADGPRSLTKAILNNRGLTPHRPKSARNPRVKKREKYDKAKRRVSSQKAVYKGGLSETGGRYEGEKSGISKVVKSVQLA